MNENDIYAILKGLGFVGSEVKTYLASLEHGPATVIELTKMTKLSRQATYVVIESLTMRGLMSSLIKGKKRYYVSEDPEKLHAYSKRHEIEMQERLKDLERILPSLKLKQAGDRPVVKFFEGKEGILTIYEDKASVQPKEIYEFFDIEACNKIFSQDDLKEGLSILKKIGTKIYGIYAGTPRGKTLESTRYFLPLNKSGFNAGIMLYGNKIFLISFTGKTSSILIESRELNNALKMLFELALKGVKDLPSD